jgi:hypothetical protein
VRKPLPQLAERDVTLELRQILAPQSHGRRKIWEFDATASLLDHRHLLDDG